MSDIDKIARLLENLTEQSVNLSTVLKQLRRLDEQIDASIEIAKELQHDAVMEEVRRALMAQTDIDNPTDTTEGGAG